MAWLVPAIHVIDRAGLQDVDARDKRGHDESLVMAVGIRRASLKQAGPCSE
jgi:hypothetical protein